MVVEVRTMHAVHEIGVEPGNMIWPSKVLTTTTGAPPVPSNRSIFTFTWRLRRTWN